jgi:hypothetical protein
MKSFKQVIAEATKEDLQTDADAHAFHAAVHKHISDPKKFAKVLKNRGSDGLHHIPVADLDLHPDLKNKYSALHTIKIGNQQKHDLKGYKGRGAVVPDTRGPRRTFLGLPILPGKKGHELQVTTMTHMNPGLTKDPSMHGFVQKHTADAWKNSFSTFRHEFEHVEQLRTKKPIKVDNSSPSAYHNSEHEVSANMASFRHHLNTAFTNHPDKFAHINPLSGMTAAHQVIKTVSDVGHHTKNVDMKLVGHWYNKLNSDNKAKVDDEAMSHVYKNYNKHKELHSNWKAAQPKPAPKPSNNPFHNGYGEIPKEAATPNFKPRIKPTGHTPEGVAEFPDESVRQVDRYHTNAFKKSETKAAAFYNQHGIKKPPHKGDNVNQYHEDNPHVVAKYLNTMHKHFPTLRKQHNLEPMNYDTNKEYR